MTLPRALGLPLALALLVLVLPGTGAATTVRMETTLGAIDIELFDEQTPLTVANFLGYVNDGDYDGTFIHRSALTPGGAPFVIQGGSFFHAGGDEFPQIPTDPPVANEPGISNLRGTIAMAKLGGQPDSATSQWFFNLGDNSVLDSSNGGFTVFGEVSVGLDVVDAIAALQRWNVSGIHPALNEVPLIDFVPGGSARIEDELVYLDRVFAVVPEPGTPLLLGSGLLGLAWRSRRR